MTDAVTPGQVPIPLFAEGARKTLQNTESFSFDTTTGSALDENESQEEAFQRIKKRVWNVMSPAKQPYDAKLQQIHDAYEGIVRQMENDNKEHKIFPLVFMAVDAKLSIVMQNRPRAVFEHDIEHEKVPIIEDAYESFTTDVEHGIDLDEVDFDWHWYNELYGWSVKRIWFDVDTKVCRDPIVVRDEKDEIVYDADGYAKIAYKRRLYRHGRVKQRVYEPDMVYVDPAGNRLSKCRDLCFVEDISYDEWEQKFKFNPIYQNTKFVKPGEYHQVERAQVLTEGTDINNKPALYYGFGTGIDPDRVRLEEYYNLDRDEYYVTANNIPILHVANPCPPDPETGEKKLPAADLHDHPRPKSFYSRGEGEVSEVFIAIYQKLMNSRTRRAQLAASPVVLTDAPSGLSPKSFKVYPGAHWRGMKGKVDVLDLSGTDRGEVSEYLQEIRSLWKVTVGVDFDRLIAAPDPTALQQEARDAAAIIRTEKDVKRYELAHVRSIDITIRNIQFWMTIPEIVDMADVPDDTKDSIKEYDKTPVTEDGRQYYRKYAKIRTNGKRYTEIYDAANDGSLNLTPDKYASEGDSGYISARPEFLRTATAVRVRAVSNRKQSANRQIRLDVAKTIYDIAFSTPPKNIQAINTAIQAQQEPPPPDDYINKQKAVEHLIDAAGADVKEMTSKEGQDHMGPATQALQQLLESKQTLQTEPGQMSGLLQGAHPGLAVKKFQRQGPISRNAAP